MHKYALRVKEMSEFEKTPFKCVFSMGKEKRTLNLADIFVGDGSLDIFLLGMEVCQHFFS